MKTKKMLINARQDNEVRVALMAGKRLIDLDVETSHRKQKKANIYKAKISRIEPSLNAVFVDYGMEKHGFLPVKEIAPHYLPSNIKNLSDINLKSLFKEGQDILIQVEKEERGNKGASISTYISLAGCYLVMMPNNPKAGGISRKIEGEARQALKAIQQELVIPNHMGAILRTACIDRSQAELQWDVDVLCKVWGAIDDAYQTASAPCLIYQESDVMLRAIRDHLREEVTEIVVDTEEAYDRVMEHIKRLRPEFVDRIKLHADESPLFSHFNIETQIETAHVREIRLPSGASIVIDPAEALAAIDINSAKATKGGNIEETALNINLEAADEIASQLRLRDLGGLIVIDFIDMSSYQDQQKVEQRLSAALKSDRARTQVNHISRFGLLEMSRQRLRSSIGESTHITCPRCQGQGTIRNIESLAMSMLRKIKHALVEKSIAEIHVQLPISVATFLLNEKRTVLEEMEQTHQVRIYIIPNPHIETPHSDIKLIKAKHQDENPSHQLLQKPAAVKQTPHTKAKHKAEKPVVQQADILHDAQTKSNKPGFFNRIYQGLFGTADAAEEAVKSSLKSNTQHKNDGQNRRKAHTQNKRKPTAQQNNRKPHADGNKPKRDQSEAKKSNDTRKQQPSTQKSGATHNKPSQQQDKTANHKPKKTPTNTHKPAPTKPPVDATKQSTQKTLPKPASKKPSSMVKAILAKETVLSSATDQKIETTATAKKPERNIKVKVEKTATEFSLSEAQERLAKLADRNMQMVQTDAEKIQKRTHHKMTVKYIEA